MFGSRNLINTPNKKTKIKSYEFTPIGATKHKENTASIKNRSPVKHTRTHANHVNSSFIDSIASSFDRTDANIDDTVEMNPALLNKNYNTNFESRDKNFINSGFSSIKEQNLQNNKLETENYNLKIKLATITKYLDSTPEEQRNIVNQNIELKQELMEQNNENKRLWNVIHQYETRENKENKEPGTLEINKHDLKLDEIIKQKDQEIQYLHEQIEELEFSNDQHVDDVRDLMNDAEEFGKEHKSMKQKFSELEKEISALKEDAARKERELKDDYVSMDIHHKQANDALLLDEEYSRLEDGYNQLEKDYEKSKESIEKFNLVIQEREREIRSLKDTITKLSGFEKKYIAKEKEEFNLRAQINSLIKEKNSKSSNHDETNQINQLLKQNERHLEEISDLQNRIRKYKSLEATLEEYEDEYKQLEMKYNSSQLECETLKKLQSKNDNKILELTNERSELIRKLNKQQPVDSNSKNNSALIELENLNRRRLETEIEQLKQKLSSKDAGSLKYYEDKIDSLTQSLIVKSDEIVKLTSDLKTLEHRQRSSMYNEDEEKTELLKLKSNNESKIRLLTLEIENLHKEHEAKLKFYENQISILQKNHSNDSLITLLEKQISELNAHKTQLNERLSEQMNKTDELVWQNNKISNENNKLSELVSNLEKNDVLVKLELSNYQQKNKLLEKEFKTTIKDCEKLSKKLINLKRRDIEQNVDVNKVSKSLISKCRDLQSEKAQLNKTVEQLNTKFNKLSMTTSNNSMDLLSNQLDYYKAKLYDINIEANDLKFMNELYNQTIKNSQNSIKREISTLQRNSIYPDYSITKRAKQKPTFKIVAQMVLAMVKLKNRASKRQIRDMRMRKLKDEIEYRKIELLN